MRILTDTVIGRTESVDELMAQGFEAVFIGSGAGLPRFMGIDGEELGGVVSANEYLTRVNLMKAYKDEYDTPIRRGKKVIVVGGGNVAMDAARCARRLGGGGHRRLPPFGGGDARPPGGDPPRQRGGRRPSACSATR